jgi:hypothetical protein
MKRKIVIIGYDSGKQEGRSGRLDGGCHHSEPGWHRLQDGGSGGEGAQGEAAEISGFHQEDISGYW